MRKMELREKIEELYDCLCDVYENETVKDDEGLISGKKRTLKYEKIKCRVSYKNGTRKLLSVSQSKIEGKSSQGVKLFVSPEYDIKAGSLIVLYKEDREFKYKHSGEAALYDTHREIVMERSEEA